MPRIAHVSDLHVRSADRLAWRLLLDKRLTGAANLFFHRARVFRRDELERVLTAAAERADHVVVTGDLTNLALEAEYAEARRLLDGLRADLVVVPGNHDLYVPEVVRTERFARHLAPYLDSDLPDLAVPVPAGRFPVVKLRGPLAFIGLSSAVPRPPFVSAGYLGKAQLMALRAVLATPEVASRTPVILVHHDPMGTRPRLEQLRRGLVDADALREALDDVPRGLLLFGHLHLRRHDRLPTRAGSVDVVCAGAAGLHHPDPTVQAGFNLYTVTEDGRIASIEAWVLDPETKTFHRGPFRPTHRPRPMGHPAFAH